MQGIFLMEDTGGTEVGLSNAGEAAGGFSC